MKKVPSFIELVILGAVLMWIAPHVSGRSMHDRRLPINVTEKINCEDVQLCTVGVEFCLKRESKCGYCEDYRQNCVQTTVVEDFYPSCSKYCAGEKSRNDIEQLRTGGCPPPSPPENGNFSGSFAYEDKVTFQCNDGYIMDGYPEIKCGNFSQWTAPPPQCKLPNITYCSPPSPPMNGSMKYDTLGIGSKVMVSCGEGFELIGPATIVCLDGGIWDYKYTSRCEPTDAHEFSLVEVAFYAVSGILLISLVINITLLYKRCQDKNSKYVKYVSTTSTPTSNGAAVQYVNVNGGVVPTVPLEHHNLRQPAGQEDLRGITAEGHSKVTRDGHSKPSEVALRGHNFSTKLLNTPC